MVLQQTGGAQVCSDSPGHKTNMATMSINGNMLPDA